MNKTHIKPLIYRPTFSFTDCLHKLHDILCYGGHLLLGPSLETRCRLTHAGQNVRCTKTSSRTAGITATTTGLRVDTTIVAFYSDAGRTSQSGGTDRPWTACDMGGRLLRRHIQKVQGRRRPLKLLCRPKEQLLQTFQYYFVTWRVIIFLIHVETLVKYEKMYI